MCTGAVIVTSPKKNNSLKNLFKVSSVNLHERPQTVRPKTLVRSRRFDNIINMNDLYYYLLSKLKIEKNWEF